MLTAATRWSSSRGSTSTILTYISLIFIFSNGVQSRSVSPFVRKDNNATITNDSPASTSSSMTALQTFNVFSGGPSPAPAAPISMPPPPPSNQSSSSITSSSITSSSTPIYSTTSLSTTTISSFAINSTSSQSLSTSRTSLVATTLVIVTSTSTGSSTESSSSPTSLVDRTTSTTSSDFPTTSTVSPTFTPVSAAAASGSMSSFWKNKPAVTAVFVIITVIACGVIGFLIVAAFKRRATRREQRLHAQLFKPYTDTDTVRTHSPDPSISSAPMDPFATPKGHFQVLAKPPPTVHLTNYNNNKSSSHLSPSLSKGPNSPPISFNNRVKRESAQPSIDSFYGGPTQPSDYKIHAL